MVGWFTRILRSLLRVSPAHHAATSGSGGELIRLPPHPANVPGPFYVEDGCCLACGVWEREAPGLLAWLPYADTPHCYVARQPETDAEFEQMKCAMDVGEVDCIRVHGCKPEWADRLRAEGLGNQIDPPEGPRKR